MLLDVHLERMIRNRKNGALGQEFLKAYIGIPYIRACFGVPKGVILDPSILI